MSIFSLIYFLILIYFLFNIGSKLHAKQYFYVFHFKPHGKYRFGHISLLWFESDKDFTESHPLEIIYEGMKQTFNDESTVAYKEVYKEKFGYLSFVSPIVGEAKWYHGFLNSKFYVHDLGLNRYSIINDFNRFEKGDFDIYQLPTNEVAEDVKFIPKKYNLLTNNCAQSVYKCLNEIKEEPSIDGSILTPKGLINKIVNNNIGKLLSTGNFGSFIKDKCEINVED